MSGTWRLGAPQLQLLLMIAIWGLSFAVVKLALDRHVPVLHLLGARFWIALLCLLPWVLRHGVATMRSEARRGVVTGVALLIGYVLQTFGMQGTTASMAGFLSGLIVLIVAAGGVAFFGERLRAAMVVGLLLGTGGLALLCLAGDAHAADPARRNTLLGILLQVASSCSYAAHILLMKHLSRPGTETVFSAWQLLTVAVGVTALLPVAGIEGGVPAWVTDPVVWWCIAYLSVFALAIGIAVQSRVQPRIRAGEAALLFSTEPAFAALGGALLLGDRLGAVEWIGGALIAIGVLVAELLPRRAR